MSTQDKKKVKRGPRVNNDQKEFLANFMLDHSDFAASKFAGPTGADHNMKTWNAIVECVNVKGPQKTVSQWQKVWADMNLRSKSKLSLIKNQQNRTGNIDDETEPLTDTDKKVLSVIGSDAVEGLQGVADSLPESVSELRKLIMGDHSPLLKKPENPVSIFQCLDIDVPISTDIEQHNVYTVIGSYTETKTKTHLPTHCTSTPSTSKSFIDTPTTRSAPTHISHNILLARPPTIQASDTTILSTTQHTYDTDTQASCSTPTHAPSTHALHTDTQAHSKLKTRHVNKRKMKEDKSAKFIELQAKQNEILETMSKAIMIAAKNETTKMEMRMDEIQIKREEIRIRKEELEMRKEELKIKRSKVEEIQKCGTTLNDILEYFKEKKQ